jgi:DNA-binding GntR family transcriptional regulator
MDETVTVAKTLPEPKLGGFETEQYVQQELIRAVMERRLKPGTKLDEDVLADVFNISRTRLRKVLTLLGTQLIVTNKPNYGSFVAKPSAAEARDVFQARRGIEEFLVRIITSKPIKPDFGPLRSFVAEEQRSYDVGHAGAIELSGNFHLKLADLAENSVLSGYLHQLVTLTILIQVLYGPEHICLAQSHLEILEAVERGNANAATELMSRHLDEIENSCDLREIDEEDVDLRAIFKETR